MEMDKQSWVIGVQVRIKTHLGETLEGVTNNAIGIKGTHTCRILKTSFVKEVTVLASKTEKGNDKGEQQQQQQQTQQTTIPQTLPAINPTIIKNREQQAIRKAQLDASRIGVNVTQQAQDIFNSLCKTLPCRWHNDMIIVFEDIKLVSPYGLSNLSGSDQAAVNRVKKVLEGERRKLGLAN